IAPRELLLIQTETSLSPTVKINLSELYLTRESARRSNRPRSINSECPPKNFAPPLPLAGPTIRRMQNAKLPERLVSFVARSFRETAIFTFTTASTSSAVMVRLPALFEMKKFCCRLLSRISARCANLFVYLRWVISIFVSDAYPINARFRIRVFFLTVRQSLRMFVLLAELNSKQANRSVL